MEDGARGVGAAPRVAIVGGGWAGCAAAVTLAAEGVPVALFEAGPVLGGRARRVVRDGLPLDNGQHLMLGAYRDTLALLAQVHGGAVPASLLVRRPLALVPLAASGDALAMTVPPAPGRLGLLLGLLLARGLTWGERWANVRWFQALERNGFARPAGETVARMLAPLPPRVATLLWEPLCVAALNTPAAAASAQVFANVLRASFAADARACDFVLNATDLTATFPDAAAHYVAARGGEVTTGTAAQVVACRRGEVTLAARQRALTCEAVIVATGPHQLTTAFAPETLRTHPPLAAAVDAMGALRYEPIVTVWLGLPDVVPLPGPIVRLDDAPGQWLIDRPDVATRGEGATRPAQVVAVVLSAGGPHLDLAHDALVQAVEAQLARLAPGWPRSAWSQVIAEKRATYACTPDRVRPAGPRLAPGVYLAGDYVDTEYPATLEAAVRSGVAAARAWLADRA
ncbi:MAG: hydroxysqualene dehydroxylase HpnE [Burkholderiales bacterium]